MNRIRTESLVFMLRGTREGSKSCNHSCCKETVRADYSSPCLAVSHGRIPDLTALSWNVGEARKRWIWDDFCEVRGADHVLFNRCGFCSVLHGGGVQHHVFEQSAGCGGCVMNKSRGEN